MTPQSCGIPHVSKINVETKLSEGYYTHMKRTLIGLSVGIAGVALHMGALWVADQTVETFPSVTDIVMEAIPFYNLFGIGEIAFWVIMAGFAFVLLRWRLKDLGYIFALLGLFYAFRGLFLLLLPIGAPADAPALGERLVIYPYASHAYFPGGHVGVMFLLAMLIPRARIRWLFLCAALLFGFGSVISRAHYSADIVGGLLVAYAVWNIGERHIAGRFGAESASREHAASLSSPEKF